MKEEEKSRRFSDWRPSDRGDAIGWAIGFIWAALVLLAQTTNFASNFSWWDGWAVFFTGAGVIALLANVIRQFIPEYPSPSVWDLIFVVILLGIGLGDYVVWFWILALFAIGIIILLGAWRGSK